MEKKEKENRDRKRNLKKGKNRKIMKGRVFEKLDSLRVSSSYSGVINYGNNQEPIKLIKSRRIS